MNRRLAAARLQPTRRQYGGALCDQRRYGRGYGQCVPGGARVCSCRPHRGAAPPRHGAVYTRKNVGAAQVP